MNPEKLRGLSQKDREMAGLETEARENIHPLQRVAEIVRGVAQNDVEHKYAEEIVKRLDEAKANLNAEVLRYRAVGKKGQELVEALLQRHGGHPEGKGWSYHRSTDSYTYEIPVTERGGGSREFNERFFKALGALKPHENLDSLRTLPQEDKKGGPVLFGGDVYNLPTVIEGTRMHATLGDKPESHLIMPMEQAEKLIETVES